MKISKSQLKQLITEAKAGMIGGIGFAPPVQEARREDKQPGPLEYKLVDAIVRAWEDHVLSQDFEGTSSSWPNEVDAAAADIEQLLHDEPSILQPVLQALERIDAFLHSGDYSSAGGDTDEYREQFTGHWRD